MTCSDGPVVTAQMLIRRPVTEVFYAFVDPAVTTRFWFSKSSGPLVTGARVRWEWEMVGVGADVTVTLLEPNRLIGIEWGEPPCAVGWEFVPHGDAATLVRITNSGFAGSDAECTAQAIDAKGGFTCVLAAAKALLEHGIELNLVADQFPRDVS